MHTIASNAGVEGAVVVGKLLEEMTLTKDMMQPKVSQSPQLFLHTGAYYHNELCTQFVLIWLVLPFNCINR